LGTSAHSKHLGKATAKCLLAVFALLLSASSASANTYRFSVSVSDLLGALAAQQGGNSSCNTVSPSVYCDSAYFGIYLQLSTAQVSSYSFVSETAPADANPWSASTITDYSDSYFYLSPPCTTNCSWAGFQVPGGSWDSSISVFSGGGTDLTGNIFKNGYFYGYYNGGSAAFFQFGTTERFISEIMPTSDVFSFIVSTTQTLSGSYTINGRASSIKSGSDTSMTADTKESDGIQFSLTETAQLTTPEPDTGAFLLIGMAGIAAGSVRRNRTKARAESKFTNR
jgi:hypothetical protein